MFSRLSRLPLRSSQRRLYKPFAGVAAVSGGLLLAAGYVHADSFEGKETTQSLDYSPQILEVLTNVPGVRQVTEAIVRATFFNQFVGGDTAEGTLPVLRSFRRGNKGALLSYSVEVDPATAASHNAGTLSTDDLPHKRIIKEMIHSIDVAADFEDSLNDGGRRTWVAVKLTALLPDAQAFIHLSKYIVQSHIRSPDQVPFPGCPRSTDLDVVLRSPIPSSPPLTKEDITHLQELYNDLRRVCEHARKRGVKFVIDAEWSWYQPAIDAFALALMREFNSLTNAQSTVQPLVYTTYQAYLRRTPSHLALSIEDAKKNGYALGVKLVRGAYHPYEIAAHQAQDSMSISPDELPPVWSHKEETDNCYNQCAKMVLAAVGEDVSNRRNHTASGTITGHTKSNKSWSSWLSGFTSTGSIQSSASNTKLPTIGVIFGTHNLESAKLVLTELVNNGLAEPLPEEQRQEDGEVVIRVNPEAAERIAIAQLFGMSDALTQYIVDRTRTSAPFVIKCIPYGALVEVMPYLSRRAIENKSVLGNGKATEERQRAGREIFKRITGQS